MVDDELNGFADEGLRHASGLGDDYEQLWVALGQAVRSGKRVRSALLLAAYRAYGGGDDPVVARVAAGIELLHTAFVVHDDVIDKDLRRRGEPNVSGVFVRRAELHGADEGGRQTLGLAAGVLAGDLALTGAISAIAMCGADGSTTRTLLDQVTQALRISAAGELDDVVMGVSSHAAQASGHSLGDIITMEERKTAVYTFQLPLQAGATLAGASRATVEALGTVGRLAGIGFQLVDDLRGVFGDEATTGKSALGDLREGKLTALVAHARGTESWPAIAPYVGDVALDDERAGEAQLLLEECGSRAFVERLAESYLDAAVSTAAQARVPTSLVTDLVDLCRRIMRSAA
jgi:geranylgeranyl diphosphate synthase, type II